MRKRKLALREYAELREKFKTRPPTICHNLKSYEIYSLAWNSSGRSLASGNVEGKVSVYGVGDSDSLFRIKTFSAHRRPVEQVLWHPENCFTLASISSDRNLRLWDTRTSACICDIETSATNLFMAWAPNGKTIAITNSKDGVDFFDTRKNTISWCHRFSLQTNACAWNHKSNVLACAHRHGLISVSRWPNMEEIITLPCLRGSAWSIEFDKSGRYFTVGTDDSVVSLWDVRSYACFTSIDRLNGAIGALSFSHDGKILATGSSDEYIDIAQSSTGRQIAKINSYSPTYTLAWHPEQYLFAFAACNRTMEDCSERLAVIRVVSLNQTSAA